jgi:DNA-binding response OmpR family regulator
MPKILIVDDDAVMVRMYETKFALDGYEVITANDGADVIHMAKNHLPNLILLDVMMPKVDGLQTLNLLKKNLTTKQIPVIMLTNVGSSEEDAQKAMEMGAVAYLVKANYTPKEVAQKVKEIMNAYTRELPKVKVKIKL